MSAPAEMTGRSLLALGVIAAAALAAIGVIVWSDWGTPTGPTGEAAQRQAGGDGPAGRAGDGADAAAAPSGGKDGDPFRAEELHRPIPDKLRTWREVEGFATGMDKPTALAVGPDGRVYVGGDERVRVFGAGGTPGGVLALPGTCRALAVTADGTLYAALPDRVAVAAAPAPAGTAAGEPTAVWPAIEGARLESIAVAGEHVFVADAGNLCVHHFDREGKRLGVIGRPDPQRGIEGLVVHSGYLDVAVGSGKPVNGGRDKLLWVANTGRLRVEGYTFAGRLEHIWGRSDLRDIAGFATCCNPCHLAVLPDGRFATSEKGPEPVVKVYGRQWTLDSVVVAAPGGLAVVELPGCPVADLAAGPDGRVYVLDATTRRVRIFEEAPHQDREAANEP